MKSFRPIYFASAALAAWVLVAGCGKKPAADVLARVGGREITSADFKAEYERRQALGEPLPDRQVLLDQMIDRETFLQQARTAGLDQAPDVRRACEDILIGKLKSTQLTPKIAALTVSSAEVQAAYEKDIARYTQPAKVKLAILFISASDKAETNLVAKAAARMQAALAQVATLPADARGFGQVAADYSDDQVTRYRGGDAGWFADDGLLDRWPREVLKTGFALKNIGDVSGVLRESDGFYVVEKMDARPPAVTPLTQVGSVIEHRLLAEKRAEAEQQFQAQARASVNVSTNAALLATISYPVQKPTQNSPASLPSASSP